MKRNRLLSSVVLTVALAIFGYATWRGDQFENQLQATLLDGDAIVDQLNRYRTTHKVYPVTLNDVDPSYAKRPPSPVLEDFEWRYSRLMNGSGFELRLQNKRQPGAYWSISSTQHFWFKSKMR